MTDRSGIVPTRHVHGRAAALRRTRRSSGRAAGLLALALALAGCGSGASGQDPTVAAPSAGAGGSDCTSVQVPAHEGTDVQLSGLDCTQARAVILAAVGKGRAAYSAEGFACTPTPAAGGDTDYVCTGPAGARLTFHYSAA